MEGFKSISVSQVFVKLLKGLETPMKGGLLLKLQN
jgi:hypothetical protein